MSFWEAFMGGEGFHWVGKTAAISVDLEKAELEALQANRTAWINTKIDGLACLYVAGIKKGAVKEFLKDKGYAFNKCLLSTYNVIGSVLNARDSAVNQIKSLPLRGLHSNILQELPLKFASPPYELLDGKKSFEKKTYVT